MPDSPITNFKDSNNVDLGKKLVTKDYLLEVYGTILENSPASGLVVTPELWNMGNGFFVGKLGNNLGTRATPVGVFGGGTNWKQVSASFVHTAAVKTDGTLWVWGDAGDGQLGNNNTSQVFTPVTTFAGGNDWKQVSCGFRHTAAIKTDGSLWVWGKNSDFAQLGINNNANRNTPVTTFAGGNNWKQVKCGHNHTAAIKTDGSLWVWGSNGGGWLGNLALTTRSTPVTTFAGGNDWKQVSAGGGNTAAIKTDGSLWIWGTNNGGRLGANITTDFADKSTPLTTFAGGTNWKLVECGSGLNAAIKTDGSLWIWGRNDVGALGINLSPGGNRRTPVTTFAGGNNWKQISGGDAYCMAIKTDGTLWGWGNNSATDSARTGNLGINLAVNPITPVTTFAGGNDWKSVSAGEGNTQAIKSIDYI